MYFRVLESNFNIRRGKIEHIEDDRFVSTVLATMYSADHLYYCFAFAEHPFCTVHAHDSQFALLNNAEVDYRVMMPAGFFSNRKFHAAGTYLDFF